MATSDPRRRAALGAGAAAVVAAAVVALVLGVGSSGARASAFAWLRPAPAPPGWGHATTPTSRGTLFYPAGWKSVPGDKGTVTRSLRDASGRYLGYLNVTPLQGGERLGTWPEFRTDHNREEGDHRVRQIAAATHLRFRGAEGSCVIDDYVSRVGGNRYREIACLVHGTTDADVLIAAALRPERAAVQRELERAVSAFRQS